VIYFIVSFSRTIHQNSYMFPFTAGSLTSSVYTYTTKFITSIYFMDKILTDLIIYLCCIYFSNWGPYSRNVI